MKLQATVSYTSPFQFWFVQKRNGDVQYTDARRILDLCVSNSVNVLGKTPLTHIAFKNIAIHSWTQVGPFNVQIQQLDADEIAL